MSVYIIKKVEKKNQTREVAYLYRLTLPSVTEKGFYRQVTSWNCFVYTNKGWNKHPDYFFFAKREEEYKREEEVWEKTCKELNIPLDSVPPSKEFSSVWDFYKEIGWDYKKKKFVVSKEKV